MKPTIVADEMFPEGAERNYVLSFKMFGDNVEDIAMGSGPIMIDIGGDEKAVHADFFNDFDDLYDDEDLD